ncbi:MAG: hypothetical protein IH977_12370, partial [Nitrospinae bacterium]|nr:hypothetical protein [Nitrospinota bacterium]
VRPQPYPVQAPEDAESQVVEKSNDSSEDRAPRLRAPAQKQPEAVASRVDPSPRVQSDPSETTPQAEQTGKLVERPDRKERSDPASPEPREPAPGHIALLVELQGRVLIRPGAPVDPQTLQSFPLTCRRVDQVACDVDLTQAESKLGQIVAEAQRHSHERLTAELQARLEASAANVRLDSEPRRIEQPVGKIRFRLQAKGRDP